MQNTNSARVTLSTQPEKLTYSVKVINASRKSQYVIRKLRDSIPFFSVSNKKKYLFEHLQENVLDMGFIEPGHGVKGKQQWLTENADLEEMYALFKKKTRNCSLVLYSKG